MIDNIYLRRLCEKIIDAMKNGYGCGSNKFNKDAADEIDVAYKPFIEKCFEKFNDMSEHEIIEKLNKCDNFYHWLIKCSNDIIYDNDDIAIESTDVFGNKTDSFWKYDISVYDSFDKESNPIEPVVVTNSWEYVNEPFERSIVVVVIDILDYANELGYQSYCLKFVIPMTYFHINPHEDYTEFCNAINSIITNDNEYGIQLFSLEPVRI